MVTPDDPRLDESKSLRIAEVAAALKIEGLRQNGRELTGPCPCCGGTDRFNINTDSRQFLCRQCDIKGGDPAALVMQVMGIGLKDALAQLQDWGMVRPLPDAAPMDPEAKRAAEKRRQEARAKAKAQEERAAVAAQKYRDRAIRDARVIWRNGEPPTSPILRGYLERRGFGPDLIKALPKSLRFIGDHPYVKSVAGQLETLHRGPCMIACIDGPGENCIAVHQTWIDLGEPDGKARITRLMGQNKDKPWPAKMVRGSKKGGVIQLTPRRGNPLVMAEGIETTLTALEAGQFPDATYWAGVDLGNMAGKMEHVPGLQHSGRPLMSDKAAFVPPPWVDHLIFIQDGDSAPKMTRAKLLSGLRRAMAHRPGLRAQIVHAGQGVDLNDLIQPQDEDE